MGTGSWALLTLDNSVFNSLTSAWNTGNHYYEAQTKIALLQVTPITWQELTLDCNNPEAHTWVMEYHSLTFLLVLMFHLMAYLMDWCPVIHKVR